MPRRLRDGTILNPPEKQRKNFAWNQRRQVATILAFSTLHPACGNDLMNSLGRFLFTCLFACGVYFLTTANIAAASKLQTIALTDKPIAGLSQTAYHGRFWDLVLSNAGHVAFQSSVTTGGYHESNPQVIWRSDATGALTPITQLHSSWLDTGVDTKFSTSIDLLTVNKSGNVLFGGSNLNPYANQHLLQSSATGNREILRRDGPSPQVSPGAKFLSFQEPIQGNGSHVTVHAATVEYVDTIYNPTVVSGLWGSFGNDLKLLVRSGMQAPGMPMGTMLHNIRTHTLNSRGAVGFMGYMTGPEVDRNNMAIWSKKLGQEPEVLVRLGDAAPGSYFPAGFTFDAFDVYSPLPFNSRGEFAFYSEINGGALGRKRTIWSGSSLDNLRLVARTSDQAPGTEPGILFKNFWGIQLNDFGRTAFYAELWGPSGPAENAGGLWKENHLGELELVMRAGDAAPGGGVFKNFGGYGFNNLGQIAFSASVSGLATEDLYGIWAEDRQGNLKLIFKIGDQLDVDNGPGIDNRTIEDFTLVNSPHAGGGRPTTFNDRGQLAFIAWFTDGTEGVFLTNAVAVPEPASFVLLLLALVTTVRVYYRESANRRAA